MSSETSSLTKGKEQTLESTAPTAEPSIPVSAIVVCFLISLGGSLFGWDTGIISGIVEMPDFLRRFAPFHEATNTYSFSVYKKGLTVSIFTLGGAIGGVTLGKLGDVFGRRMGLAITFAVYAVGVVLQIIASHSWALYFVGRIIVGLAEGSTLVLCPMYISEVSPRKIRGTMVCFFQVSDTIAILAGYIMCYGCYHNYTDSRQWRPVVAFGLAWMIFSAIGVLIAPESPRYLVEKNKLDHARRSLARIYKVPQDSTLVTSEVERLVKAVETERSEKASWKELFNGQPRIGYRLCMGIILDSLQCLTGNTYFLYYGTSTFMSVGMADGYETSIILGLVVFVSTLFALYGLDHLGRRNTLMLGSIGMVICFVVYGTLGQVALYPDTYGVDPNKKVGDVMILFTCLYLFSFCTTWGPGIYVILGESFPMRVRSQAIAIATAFNWIWGFIVAFFTPTISGKIHFAYGYVFAGVEVFAVFYVFFFVPETKGLSLEDVDALYEEFTPGLAFRAPKGPKFSA